MYKILAFILVIVLVLRGIGALVRLLFGSGLAGRTVRDFQDGRDPGKKKRTSGNVDIDYVPREEGGKSKKGFKGGEYVDYEDVQ